eukprot:SAG11_NODE_1431_length_4937_cov_1.954940_2_plen_95_part_00
MSNFACSGEIHTELGRYDEALADYDAALYISPKFVAALAKAAELRSLLFRIFGILPVRWGVSPATQQSKAVTTIWVIVGLGCTLSAICPSLAPM